MSRISRIEQTGMGSQVLKLASAGNTPGRISATVSTASGQDISTASVRRYLDKQSVNAAIPDEHAAFNRLVAAITGKPDERDDKETAYYGSSKLNAANNFTMYYGLARGLEHGQVLRGFSNIALKITNGARIVGDERDIEKIYELSKAINFSTLLQDTVRSTCEMGTLVMELQSEKGELITPQILPMRYITLLTDKETPGVVDATLVHGDVSQIVFNEGGDTQHVYQRDEVGLFRIWSGGNEFTDIQGRNTDSIYGTSMTIGLKTPLKSILNSSRYYDMFIHDFGLGRYVHNMKALADLVLNKVVSPAAAEAARDETVVAMQNISANENIVTVGDEIHMMDSRTGFDIMPFIEWREHQINRTLLQSDVASGDVGNSWTSSGTAVNAADYETYNSLRNTLFDMFMTEIITPRCEAFNLKPETLSIAATPFLKVDVPFPDMITMVDMGVITESELRDRGGFPPEKPDEE